MVETKTIIFWKHNSQLFRDQILFPMYELDDCFDESTPKQNKYIQRERERKKGKRKENHTVSFFVFFVLPEK